MSTSSKYGSAFPLLWEQGLFCMGSGWEGEEGKRHVRVDKPSGVDFFLLFLLDKP